MKEKNIHDLIEQGNKEQKNKSWEVLEENLNLNEIDGEQHNGRNTLSINRSKKFIICTATASAILLALILFLILFDFDKSGDDFRFYSESEYSQTITDITVKEYSEQNDLGLLYFNWYDETYFLEDIIYILSETNEIICYHETIFDNDLENLISFYIISKDVELDFLSAFENVCNLSYESSSGINVLWGGDNESVYALFEHKKFKYYLNIEQIGDDIEGILHYVEVLIG